MAETAKQQVGKIYQFSYAGRAFEKWQIIASATLPFPPISDGFNTEEEAWADALRRIKEAKKP